MDEMSAVGVCSVDIWSVHITYVVHTDTGRREGRGEGEGGHPLYWAIDEWRGVVQCRHGQYTSPK